MTRGALVKVQKPGNGLVLPDGITGRVVRQVKAVALPGRLDDLHLPAPPARPERLAVRAAAVAEHVLLREAHENAPARQRAQRRRAARERVDPGVVEASGRRGHDAPHLDQVLGHGGVPLLGGHPAAAQEVRVDQDDAADPGAAGEPLGAGGAHGHVVRDVGPRAIAGEGQAGEVGVVGEPGLIAGAAGGDPDERPPRVLVRGGDGVLGREAVLDGDDDGPGARREGVEVPVDDAVEGAEEAEAAAVEVDKDGKPAAPTVLGSRREVEADGDVGRDGAVFGRNAGARVGGGREGVGAEVALDESALENTDEVRRLEDDLVVRSTGAGHGCLKVLGLGMEIGWNLL
ncbi:unnamed protein product [Urochloa decumbens]|uniref:Uncharacterized protein n=1 Tax=Urochloa decumbens TaxID=240449 RepID=A0ABC9CUT8_9POAL